MNQAKTLMIVNPISGGKKKSAIPQLMQQLLNKELFGYPDVAVSEYAGHSSVLAAEAVEDQYSTIIIAGGDGTINEVGSVLAGTQVRLGIIPCGSGNGLARHLKIPVSPVGAIQGMNNNNVIRIDAGKVNDHYFFCTSGVGFDAWIGYLFATSKTRGFWSYVTTALKEFYRYKAEQYEISINGEVNKHEAFLITVANAAQYGNEAIIAPTAEVNDGKLDICLLSPFPKLRAAEIGIRLFSRSIHRSVYLNTKKITEARITRKAPGVIHIDGEPLEMGEVLNYKIVPSCLNILIP